MSSLEEDFQNSPQKLRASRRLMSGLVDCCLLALTSPSIMVIASCFHNPGADVGRKECERVMSCLSEATRSTRHRRK